MDMWFLVQTKPRQERRAVENLERQGVMSFCPVVNMEKISRGRRMVVEEVLFPGYLFVNFNQHKVSATSINPLSPPLRSPQQRPQGHPAKSKFLAVSSVALASTRRRFGFVLAAD